MKIYNQLNNFRRVLLTITIAISIKGAKGQVELINTPVNYKTLAQANSEYDNKAINTNLAVGAIEGKFEVTLSGNANYHLKPDMPPGIKGLMPNMEIVYNSQTGSSMLGRGWSLMGLSSISRAPFTNYHHGKTSEITTKGGAWVNREKFTLDGNYLIPNGYLNNFPTTFGTEIETFNKITPIWGYKIFNDCPDYFIVETKDGLYLEYGRTADAKVEEAFNGTNGVNNNYNIMAWKVNKIMDKHGNYVIFKYKNIYPTNFTQPYNYNHVLDEITYTHNDNVPGAVINKIKFEYKVRKDINESFIENGVYIENYLLASISSYSGNTLYSKLEIDYAYDNNTSLVESIRKSNKNGEYLNNTKFKYTEFNNNLLATKITPAHVLNNPVAKDNEIVSNRAYADFNGDGYSDYVATYQTVINGIGSIPDAHVISKYEIFENNKDLTFKKIKTIGTVYEKGKKFFENPKSNFNLVNDYNGDNLQDMVSFNLNMNDSTINSLIYHSYNLVSKSFDDKNVPLIATDRNFFNGYTPVNGMTLYNSQWTVKSHGANWVLPGDYNGDGKSELLLVVDIYLTENWRNGTSTVGQVNNSYAHTSRLIQVNLVDGTFKVLGATSLSTQRTIWPCDHNGDGATDLIFYNGGSSYAVYLGQDILQNSSWSVYNLPNGFNFKRHIEFGDFNGDRKTDILTYDSDFSFLNQQNGVNTSQFYQTNNSYKLLYSTGKGFIVRNNLDIPNYPVNFMTELVKRYYTVADFDYDGKSDILEFIDVGTYENNSGEIDEGGNYWNSIPNRQLYRTFYSNGRNFDCKKNNILINNSDIDPNPNQYQYTEHWVKLADINGDGYPDVCHTHKVLYTSMLQYNTVLLTNNNNISSKLLNGIKNGYNSEIVINYDRLNNEKTDIYKTQFRICSFPTAYNFSYPMRLVSGYTTPDGIGGVVQHKWLYKDMVYDFQKGFLGFANVEQRNYNDKTYLKYSSVLETKYKILNLSNSENGIFKLGGGNVITYESISSESFINDCLHIGSTTSGIAGKRHVNLIKEKTSYNYLTNVESKTIYNYDTKANSYRLLTIENNVDNSLVVNTTSYQNYIAAGSHVTNKPLNIIKTSTRSGKSSITSETQYQYNSTTGDIEYEIINKGLPCETKISYDYDIVGNIWKKTTLPIGSSANTSTVARTEESAYDPSKRFVEKKYNIMGQLVNTTLYDPISGVPTSSTDMNGEKTTYEYDNWNKLKATRIPSRGIGTWISFSWGSGGGYIQDVTASKSPYVRKRFDQLGRLYETESEGRFYKPTISHVSYNSKGQKIYETNEYYYTTENPFETTTVYDDYGRVTSVTNPNGTTTVSYAYPQTGVAEVTTTNPQGQVKKTYIDASGKTFKVEDIHGKVILNDYNSLGQLLNTKLDGLKTIEYIYDVCGQLERQIDKANGTLSYTYDEWGQVKSKKNARNQIESYVYDNFGRKIQRTNPEGVTSYSYVPFSSPGRNQISKIFTLATNTKNNILETYTYDSRGNVKSLSKNIGGVNMSVSYTYLTHFNLVKSKIYSSGVKLDYHYNMDYNMLERISSGTKTIYQIQDVNSFDKPTQYLLGNGLTTNNAYDQNYPLSSYTPMSGSSMVSVGSPSPLLDYQVSFDKPSGNVQYRLFSTTLGSFSMSPTITGFVENFTYDSKDRLKSSEIGSNIYNINYDAQENGNIIDKDDVGIYKYDKNGKNQVVEIENPTASISPITQYIDYTSFEQPSILFEGNNKLFLNYSDNQQRIRGIWYKNLPAQSQNPNVRNDVLHRLRYYFGDMEINVERDAVNQTQFNADYIHYVHGIDGHMVAIIKNHVKNFDANAAINGSTQDQNSSGVIAIDPNIGWNWASSNTRLPDEYYFTYTDHLGSILMVTDQTGGIVATQNFDAWGRYRDMYSSGSFIASTGNPSWLYRGYTGHEHLDEFVLINMNGRLYDPVVARFLSTDLYIADPENSNTYNRYTYCLNNPLKYTDPDGEHPIIIGAAIGMAIAGSSYFINAATTKGGLEYWNWGDFAKALAIGGIKGAASAGVGSILSGIAAPFADMMTLELGLDFLLLGGAMHATSSIAQHLIFSSVFNHNEGDMWLNAGIAAVSHISGHFFEDVLNLGSAGSTISSVGMSGAIAAMYGADPIAAMGNSLIVNLANRGLHSMATRIYAFSKIHRIYKEARKLSTESKDDCVPAQLAAILLAKKGVKKTTTEIINEYYGTRKFTGVSNTEIKKFLEFFGLKVTTDENIRITENPDDYMSIINNIQNGNYAIVARETSSEDGSFIWHAIGIAFIEVLTKDGLNPINRGKSIHYYDHNEAELRKYGGLRKGDMLLIVE